MLLWTKKRPLTAALSLYCAKLQGSAMCQLLQNVAELVSVGNKTKPLQLSKIFVCPILFRLLYGIF